MEKAMKATLAAMTVPVPEPKKPEVVCRCFSELINDRTILKRRCVADEILETNLYRFSVQPIILVPSQDSEQELKKRQADRFRELLRDKYNDGMSKIVGLFFLLEINFILNLSS